jgi:hypothetical protein
MRFDEFWNKVRTLNDWIEFETLKQKKKFKARYYVDNIAVTPEESHQERTIDQNQFIKIWNVSKKHPKHEQYRPVNYQFNYNASYILAIMKHFLGEEGIE